MSEQRTPREPRNLIGFWLDHVQDEEQVTYHPPRWRILDQMPEIQQVIIEREFETPHELVSFFQVWTRRIKKASGAPLRSYRAFVGTPLNKEQKEMKDEKKRATLEKIDRTIRALDRFDPAP